MKKPTQHQVLAVAPLSEVPERGDDPIRQCNVCGLSSDSLAAWREHDERDLPLDGARFLVFIGKDHPACIKAMDKHPRLYAEVRGEPGTFPRLCGDCSLRRGLECSHPKLRANGGDGLLVNLDDPLHGAIICGRGGRITPVNHALTCEGKTTVEVKAGAE